MIGFLLKSIFGSMEPGQIIKRRMVHRTDPKKDRTVLVISGRVDPLVLAGAMRVLEGNAHARSYSRKKEATQMTVREVSDGRV